MKMTNYRLQTEIENIKTDKQEWFKNYVRQVLESNKPYHAKADYIGLSIKEIDNKIAYISDDIKELQALKKKLTVAKAIALEATAEVLAEYGIDRLDGTAISSITIAPAKEKENEHLEIVDEDALIQLGYAKVTVDKEAVMEAMKTLETMDEIDPYVVVFTEKEKIPAKLKINPRRGSVNNQANELLKIVENQAA